MTNPVELFYVIIEYLTICHGDMVTEIGLFVVKLQEWLVYITNPWSDTRFTNIFYFSMSFIFTSWWYYLKHKCLKCWNLILSRIFLLLMHFVVLIKLKNSYNIFCSSYFPSPNSSQFPFPSCLGKENWFSSIEWQWSGPTTAQGRAHALE